MPKKNRRRGRSATGTPRLNHNKEIFTLADEARETGQHDHSTWSQGTKLRSMPIAFKSAGNSEPLKTYEENTEDEEIESREGIEERDDTSQPQEEKKDTRDAADTDNAENCMTHIRSEESAEASSLFYYDASRVLPVVNGPHDQLPMIQMLNEGATSPERSDSEEEVILFKGRLNMKHEARDCINLSNIHAEICAVESEMKDLVTLAEADDEAGKIALEKKARRKRGGKQARAGRVGPDEDDDRMLADYIANMRENGEMDGMLHIAEMPGPTDYGDESPDESDMEFDFMDWERPSISRKRGKGAKKKLDLRFADIDSETERKLQAAWQSDRTRKAERKRERQERRALSLLGRGNGQGEAENMRAKYPKGMSLQQVADELKSFHVSSENSICLPPMDKHARKMIHELASKFNINSKSIGKADQRRPTLHRSKRTLRFDEEAFDRAVRGMHRRFFPRLEFKGKSSTGLSSRSGYAEASYRDGEVVGASAPELSTENRGRAMLEKMGWSVGTALGSTNKGILLPVMQTMKRSKAGLG